jgi:hypothetical protein
VDLIVTPNTEASGAPAITATEFNVMHGPFRVGRVRQDGGLGPASQWIWALTGVLDGPNAMRRAGVAATIEEARASLKDSWEQWLVWAGFSQREPLAGEPATNSDVDNQDDDLFSAVEAHLPARR